MAGGRPMRLVVTVEAGGHAAAAAQRNWRFLVRSVVHCLRSTGTAACGTAACSHNNIVRPIQLALIDTRNI